MKEIGLWEIFKCIVYSNFELCITELHQKTFFSCHIAFLINIKNYGVLIIIVKIDQSEGIVESDIPE